MPDVIDLAPRAQQHLADIRSHLTGAQDHEQAIHAARRGLKALRALLRLARSGATGREDATLDRIGRRLADQARSLAPARDLRVTAREAHRLAGMHPGRTTRAALLGLAGTLEKEASALESASADGTRAAAALVLDDIAAQLHAMALWRTPAALAEGAGETYRRGRRARRSAFASATDESLHDLRNLVVRHQLQTALLGDLAGGRWAGRVRRANRLRDLLGEHHDLAVLLGHVAGRRMDERTLRRLRKLALGLQEQRETEASDLARAVFRARPRDLEARLRSALEA